MKVLSNISRFFKWLFPPILRAQIVKEILCTLRDPRARLSLLLPPMMQLFLFSFAVTLDVKNVNIAVFDQDGGRWAQEFVTTIDNAGFVGKIISVHSLAQIEEKIEASEVLTAIIIPQDFSADIISRKRVAVQVLIDGRRANAGQIVTAYITSIAANLGANTQQITPQTPQIGSIRYWFNPTLVYQWFVVPSLAAILVTMTALSITGMSIARERELGTFDQLLVSPANYFEIIVAKTMPALIIGPLMGLMMIFAGIFLFKVPFNGSFPLLVLSLYVHVFAVVGLGLIVSAISQTQQQAILGVFTLQVPMMLMSGFSTPTENMPHFFQLAAEAVPNKHMLLILQGTFLKGQGVSDIMFNLVPLIIIGIVGLTAATFIVRSRLQ